MKKNRIHIILFSLLFLAGFNSPLMAQVKIGNNPRVLNNDAALEIESSNKGLLLPRLSLSSTTSAAPLSNFVQGMMIFNTATQNDVTPGIYYCDGTKWLRTSNGATTTGTTVKKSIEIVAVQGQTVFTTPAPVTDINKISLYRNGVMISFSINNANSIIAEMACATGDEIRIVQIL